MKRKATFKRKEYASLFFAPVHPLMAHLALKFVF